jgi:predicted nucleotide-binding protein
VPAEDVVEERPEVPAEVPAKPLRVFIAHGRNMAIVEQVQTVLELADIESEIAEEEETTAIPVPEKVFEAMRRCSAGIIVVSVENGGGTINENVLVEIGAAFVLYERRVVLVWDKRLAVPSNLQGLYRCEYEGDDLGWAGGVKLMKAIQQFKR